MVLPNFDSAVEEARRKIESHDRLLAAARAVVERRDTVSGLDFSRALDELDETIDALRAAVEAAES